VGGDRNLYGAGNPREDDRDRRSAESGRTGETEYQLHCAAVDTIRRWILPGWIYTHIASGEKRDQATAARLNGTGVVGGFPDLMFFDIKGEVCYVELNAEGGRMSES
jgi:hypothetical protein